MCQTKRYNNKQESVENSDYFLKVKEQFLIEDDRIIFKLLNNWYTFTEILNWTKKWNKIIPQERLMIDAKNYLFNNFTITCKI